MGKISIVNPAFTELFTISAVISAQRTEKINGENALGFTTILKEPLAGYINDINTIRIDGDYFDIAEYKKEQQSDGRMLVSVDCEHISYRLNDSVYDKDYFTEKGTPTEIMVKILEGTPFSVGTIDFTEETTYSAQEKKSRRQILMEFVALLGGEVSFNGFEVSVLIQRGSTEPIPLIVGKHLTFVSKAVNKRERDSNGNPFISYECGLYKAGIVSLGDVVTLDYDRLDINITLRVLSISVNPYDSRYSNVTIGNYKNALENDLYRIETQKTTKDKNYYGVRIGPEKGFEIKRNDGLAEAVYNADKIAMRALVDGKMSDVIYFDTTERKYKISGAVKIENTVSSDDLTALEATVKQMGGRNLLYNSSGMFENDYWDGNVKSYTDTEVQQNFDSKNCFLLQEGGMNQLVLVSNGDYYFGFKYKKLVADADCKIKFNGFSLDLTNANYETADYNFTVQSGEITIEIISDTDDACYIGDLIAVKGVKQLWSANPNEVFTDTVKIGKGIEIGSNTANTRLVANVDGIRIKNKLNDTVITEFTDKGLETEEVSSNSGKIGGVLIAEVYGQTWISSLL